MTDTGHRFTFGGTDITAMAEGALWVPAHQTLCVSDLHLGKSNRIARRSGRMLPPYETRETLARLSDLIDRMNPKCVISLGDSFDDLDAVHSLNAADIQTLLRLQAGRDWVWIEGNHDPGPVDLGGRHLHELKHGGLTYRHIAEAEKSAEISGHYHPKCTLPRGGTRPAFLASADKIIMPAFGAFTGGLRSNHPTLQSLMGSNATAILTGRKAMPVPYSATL